MSSFWPSISERREGNAVYRRRLGWLDHRLLGSSDLWDLLAARGLDLRVLVCAPAGGNSPLRAASGLHALRLGVPFVLPRLGQAEVGSRVFTRGTG